MYPKVIKVLFGGVLILILMGTNLFCYQLSARSAKERYGEELAAKEQEIDRLAAEYEEELEKLLEEDLAQLESLREEIKYLTFHQVEEEPEKQPATWENMLEGFVQEPSTATKEEAMEAYEAFLNGERNSNSGMGIEEIIFPKGEPDKPWSTRYAYSDLTGDGLPELIIETASVIWRDWILTYQDGELVTWHYQISSGNMIQDFYGNGDLLREYSRGTWPYFHRDYAVINKHGEEVWYIQYFWDDEEHDRDGIHGEVYSFDGIEMTRESWEKCINKLPNADELEWIVLFDQEPPLITYQDISVLSKYPNY